MRESTPPTSPAPAAPLQTPPLRVLVIEDNLVDARLIQIMVSDAGGEGFQIERADRLETGLKRLATEGFGMVLLDLSLPDSHGLEVLQPFAFPGAIGDVLERRLGEQRAQRLGIGSRVDLRLDADARPQRCRSRRRLQHGIIGGIFERDRRGTGCQQLILEGRRVGGADRQCQLQKRHGLT